LQSTELSLISVELIEEFSLKFFETNHQSIDFVWRKKSDLTK